VWFQLNLENEKFRQSVPNIWKGVMSSLTTSLQSEIHGAIESAGGWLAFDDFMARALYTPGLGYYANNRAKFGTLPAGVKGQGSDFVTAPEMTPLFGRTLAAQVAQALAATHTEEIWEFGAGSGALALQMLDELARLAVPVTRYNIVDVSGSLRARQRDLLKVYQGKVVWLDELPIHMQGVVIGNEVLDAMPVKLLVRKKGEWFERGVASKSDGTTPTENTSPLYPAEFVWQDRPTSLRPPHDVDGPHDYLTEIHPQAEAFIQTLADKLTQGAAFFIDYGFPEGEYFHPQRHMGTLMCHQAHLADANPLLDVGQKDITAHVNFSGIALAGQNAGFDVLGYCTQARFLMNCGLLQHLEAASLQTRNMAQKLILEHEMGELFKVIAFGKAAPHGDWQPMGFAQGDRTHTL
jgi:SAM-dependent MidA family methyltransferase